MKVDIEVGKDRLAVDHRAGAEPRRRQLPALDPVLDRLNADPERTFFLRRATKSQPVRAYYFATS